jgi:CheY-like chemotaxis protein
MVHFGTAMIIDTVRDATPVGDQTVLVQHSVLVVRDANRNNEYLDAVCEFLGIGIGHVTPGEDLEPILRGLRPMAVIADLENEVADGFHVMKMTASFDQSLPILLLTQNDPALLGAVDAVREVWGLRRVATSAGDAVGELVDFICHAARHAGKSRLMRV